MEQIAPPSPERTTAPQDAADLVRPTCPTGPWSTVLWASSDQPQRGHQTLIGQRADRCLLGIVKFDARW